jgi:hypothetical protein
VVVLLLVTVGRLGDAVAEARHHLGRRGRVRRRLLAFLQSGTKGMYVALRNTLSWDSSIDLCTKAVH